MTNKNWFLAVGFLCSLTASAWIAIAARNWTMQQLNTPDARTEWSEWKRDVERQQATAVVQRRVPKSDEPPWLVLMRDHFPVMLASSMVAGAVAFGFAVFSVQVLRSSVGPAGLNRSTGPSI